MKKVKPILLLPIFFSGEEYRKLYKSEQMESKLDPNPYRVAGCNQLTAPVVTLTSS